MTMMSLKFLKVKRARYWTIMKGLTLLIEMDLISVTIDPTFVF